MPTQTDKLIAKIQAQVDNAIIGFNNAMPAVELNIWQKLQLLLKDLDLKDGNLVRSAANIRAIARLKNQIEIIIRNPYYRKEVKDFANSFNEVAVLQQNYFASIVADFTAPAVLEAIKQDAIASTVEALTESGITSNVTNAIQDILRTNITTGGSYTELVDQVRAAVVTTSEGDGILTRYIKQQTTDSINQFSATYNYTIAQSLNYNWFRFTGSLLTTSRPMCVHMVPVQFFHIKEIPELLEGLVRGVQTPLSKKTGLPLGFKENTTESNYIALRNGWQCGHQIFMCSEAAVPKETRIMIYNKFGIKYNSEGLVNAND